MDNKALQGLAICLLIGLVAGAVVGYTVAPKDTAAVPTVSKSAINTSTGDFGKKLALYQDMRKGQQERGEQRAETQTTGRHEARPSSRRGRKRTRGTAPQRRSVKQHAPKPKTETRLTKGKNIYRRVG